jgi:hypothetical protein
MVAPETPTGGAIRQAVLDDQANRSVNDASRVVTTRRSKVGHVGIEILAAAEAIVLRVKHDQVAWPLGERVAEVVENAARQTIAIGTMAATRAETPAVVAAPEADVGLGQVVNARDPLGGIGSIFAGPWHDETPGRKILPRDTLSSGVLFIKMAR